MKNRPNIYDYVLSTFKGSDVDRPALSKVFMNKNYCCATDGHCLIIVQDILPGLEYSEDPDSPNALKLIEESNTDSTIIVTRSDLMSYINKAEIIWSKQFKPCEVCSGAGFKICKCCDAESDCKECYGSGNSHETIPFTTSVLDGEVIEFAENTFDPNLLNKVVQTSYFLEENRIKVNYLKGHKNKAVLFEIGKVTVLLMPRYRT